jgi:hypothetical protein
VPSVNFFGLWIPSYSLVLGGSVVETPGATIREDIEDPGYDVRVESCGALDESEASTDPKVDAGGPVSVTAGPGDKVGVHLPRAEDRNASDTSGANIDPETDAGGPDRCTGVPESGPDAGAEDVCGSVAIGYWIPGAALVIGGCRPSDVALGAVGAGMGGAVCSSPATDYIRVIAWDFLGCICTG